MIREIVVAGFILLGLGLLLKILIHLLKYVFKLFSDGDLDESLAKMDPHLHGVKYPVSYWSEKGARPYQEDRFHALRGILFTQPSMYGVFDGHGGHLAAQHCKDNLLQSIASDPDWERSPVKSITNSFFKVNAEFSQKAKVRMLNDGSTAVVAVIDRDKIYVANAGDSRGILVQRGGRVRPMSLDHRPERKDEESRIRRLGGKLIYWGRWRVEGVLAVSRAIGDVNLQPFVTCDPEITEKNIEPEDEFLVLASDGLWDVMDNEQVAKIVINQAKYSFMNIAKNLCSEAIILGSSDNVTVLVIDLRQRAIVVENGKTFSS